MTTQAIHRDLAARRWGDLTLAEQLGNAGADVGRAIRSRGAGDADRFAAAVDRALDLLDLTLTDDRWAGSRRREIARAREVLCDFLLGDNVYVSTAESTEAWFMAYAMAARRGK